MSAGAAVAPAATAEPAATRLCYVCCTHQPPGDFHARQRACISCRPKLEGLRRRMFTAELKTEYTIIRTHEPSLSALTLHFGSLTGVERKAFNVNQWMANNLPEWLHTQILEMRQRRAAESGAAPPAPAPAPDSDQDGDRIVRRRRLA